jgi:hypothetical protein
MRQPALNAGERTRSAWAERTLSRCGGRRKVDLAGFGKHGQEQLLAFRAPAGEPLARIFQGNAVEGGGLGGQTTDALCPSTSLRLVPLPQTSWGRNGRK